VRRLNGVIVVTGTISEDENTITGAWEKCLDGGEREHDFALTYPRAR
jgi:hypothetical protein